MKENPLTDDDCQCLDGILQSIAKTRELIAKCKDCDLNMDKAEVEIEAQERLARGLKRNFFPNRP